MFFANRFEREALINLEEIDDILKEEKAISVDIIVEVFDDNLMPYRRTEQLDDASVGRIVLAFERFFGLFPRKSLNADEFIAWVVQHIIEDTSLVEWQVRALLDRLVKTEKNLLSIAELVERLKQIDVMARRFRPYGNKMLGLLSHAQRRIASGFTEEVLEKIRMTLPDFPNPTEIMGSENLGCIQLAFLAPYSQFFDVILDGDLPSKDLLVEEIDRRVMLSLKAISNIKPWPILPMYFHCHTNNENGDKIETSINGVHISAAAVYPFATFADNAMPPIDELPKVKAHYENIWNEIISQGIIVDT